MSLSIVAAKHAFSFVTIPSSSFPTNQMLLRCSGFYHGLEEKDCRLHRVYCGKTHSTNYIEYSIMCMTVKYF